MENLKVMEAAYNFTDAVIENKDYTIEKSCDMLCCDVKNMLGTKNSIAYYTPATDSFREVLPIRDKHQQELKEACLKYDNELKAAEQREKQLKAEFEAWRASNGK